MEAEQQQAPPSARDWSELPVDALASVFAKLGPVEILFGAGLVCHSWLDAAKVPYLWRHLNMDSYNGVVMSRCLFKGRDVMCAMAMEAVDRSAGQLEVFIGGRFPDDHLLKYIGSRAPSLKALRLSYCGNILNNEAFVEAINMFPLLEELELSFCGSIGGRSTYEAVGKACQNLKSFQVIKNMPYIVSGAILDSMEKFDVEEAHGIATMHGLRSLKIFSSRITNEALAVILGNCPDLESLELRDCCQIVMDDAMRAKCAGIKMSGRPKDHYGNRVYNNDPPWMAFI